MYDAKNEKLGVLLELPTECRIGDVISIEQELYRIAKVYDSDNPMDEKDEVIFYELEPFVYKPDYNLGDIL